MKKFFKENRKGFTLIELLVVIAILAVLATLYVPRIISSTNNAKETVDISNARTLASEITMINTERSVKGEALFKGDGALPSGFSEANKTKYSTYKVVEEDDITGSSIPEIKKLLDGRTFPSSAVILSATDGSCIVVKANGDALN